MASSSTTRMVELAADIVRVPEKWRVQVLISRKTVL